MKTLSMILAALATLALGAFFLLYSSLDAIVKKGIEKYGSEIALVSISVDKVKLSPTNGLGVISSLTIDNPKGFKTAYAASVGTIEIALEPTSIAKDVILIHKLAVLAPDIHYESSGAGSNFDAIQRNVNQSLGSKHQNKSPGKKMIIETLSIHDAKAHYSPALMQGKEIELSLPNIDLHNIGKDKGGATSGEVTKAIIDALSSQLTKSVGRAAKSAVESVGKAAKGLGSSMKEMFI